MKITVFTSAYNRGYIIENLYYSLQRQIFCDFEWIVIDDGSSDNTEDLFQQWINDNNSFPIIYKKIKNGGKHRAINIGVKLAKGDLFFIVDSDDYLTDDALKKVVDVENSITEKEKEYFAGVCGQKAYSLDKCIGSTFKGTFLDITTLERAKHNITGDKAEVFYTELLKKYPFPEIDGEKFVTECVVWDKIAADGYKLRFFNAPIYICDYLPDGLTHQGSKLFRNNPIGWGIYINQSIKYGKISRYQIQDVILDYYRNSKSKLTLNQISTVLHIPKLLIVLITISNYICERVRALNNRFVCMYIK